MRIFSTTAWSRCLATDSYSRRIQWNVMFVQIETRLYYFEICVLFSVYAA